MPPPTGNGIPTVLNVAEKPSVARSLAAAFARIPQSRENGPMRREAAQIFTHDNVMFPYIFSQANNNEKTIIRTITTIITVLLDQNVHIK